MKKKKWLITLSIILLILSQSQIGRNLLHLPFGSKINLSPYFSVPLGILFELLGGSMSIINALWTFLLSLNGVLLIGFILVYQACKKGNI